jgi:hypothetical protein
MGHCVVCCEVKNVEDYFRFFFKTLDKRKADEAFRTDQTKESDSTYNPSNSKSTS